MLCYENYGKKPSVFTKQNVRDPQWFGKHMKNMFKRIFDQFGTRKSWSRPWLTVARNTESLALLDM